MGSHSVTESLSTTTLMAIARSLGPPPGAPSRPRGHRADAHRTTRVVDLSTRSSMRRGRRLADGRISMATGLGLTIGSAQSTAALDADDAALGRAEIVTVP